MLIGSFDHYYVNISFPHMVAVFWIVQAVVLRMSMLRSSMRSSAKEWGLQR
ncbi:MAG: hypothetical protein N2Z82_08245 [Thermomicrobium sp.]|nr:hypothetical protein [Thermomicrobium sp.]